MKKIISYTVLTAIFFSFSLLVSRSFRVSQIPNGNINACANCHIDPSGGGSRNAFGQQIESGFLSPSGSGNVQWGVQLASLDSDGDGFTNGEELQDPFGAWTSGQPQPGNPNLITNPGNPNDFPTSVNLTSSIPASFDLSNNYPNPFNPATSISFGLPHPAHVKIEIFNSLGQLVSTPVNDFYPAGQFKTGWNGTDESGSPVSSGLYIYRMSTDKFIQSKRMLLLK